MKYDDMTILSIGHGARRIEELLELLSSHRVEFLIDVRSKPRSRFHPQYNQRALDSHLASAGIRYIFMGEELGGIPNNPNCYDEDGHVSYQRIMQQDFYVRGIDRLLTAHSKGIRVACMCSELDACDCHRSKLIGESLAAKGVEMVHIGRLGTIETQLEVMQNLKKAQPTGDLFANEGPQTLRSRKSYR